MGIKWGFWFLVIDLKSLLWSGYPGISNKNWLVFAQISLLNVTSRFYRVLLIVIFTYSGHIYAVWAAAGVSTTLRYSSKSALFRKYRHKLNWQLAWDIPTSLYRTAGSSRRQYRLNEASSTERSLPAFSRIRWLHRSTYESAQCRFSCWHEPRSHNSGSW